MLAQAARTVMRGRDRRKTPMNTTRWDAYTLHVDRCKKPQLVEAALVGSVIYAHGRTQIGGPDEFTDSSMGILAWIEPSEIYVGDELPGGLALVVMVELETGEHTHRTWLFSPNAIVRVARVPSLLAGGAA